MADNKVVGLTKYKVLKDFLISDKELVTENQIINISDQFTAIPNKPNHYQGDAGRRVFDSLNKYLCFFTGDVFTALTDGEFIIEY